MSSRCRRALALVLLLACEREDRNFRSVPPGASASPLVTMNDDLQPGSTIVVAFFSAMIAGPAITSPGCTSSRTTRAASCHAAPEYMRTVSRRGTSRTGCSAWRGSAGASPATTASTDTASTIMALPGIRKEKRWR